MFDRIVLINLKRRPERLAAFHARRTEKGWPLPEPEILAAIDGNRVGVPAYYGAGGGAWGCRCSHVEVLQRALMDDAGKLLVLEDDVTWMSNGWDQLKAFMEAVPDDWDQIMLGGQHMQPPTQVVPGVHRCANTQRTHAYAVRGRALRDLLGLWYTCQGHIDHAMGPWQRGWKVYAPDPFVFGQGAGQSDISGRVNPPKFWNPPSASARVVHLTCPRSVVRQLRGRGFHTGHDRVPLTDLDRGLCEVVAAPNQRAALKNWLDVILWEAASDEGAVATVWHPDVPVELVRSAYSGEVVEITGNTVEECLAQLPGEIRQKPARVLSHVILLRAPREAAERLSGRGWHIGYWRDQVTGQDNGLRRIAAMPAGSTRATALAAWVGELSAEAEGVSGGIVCAWHPDITAAELAEASPGRTVVEVEAQDDDQARAVFAERLKDKS